MSDGTRISLVLRSDGTVQTHIEAAAGAEPLDVYSRAISALKAEKQSLPNCPVHREPTFRQEIERLARWAQVVGDSLDRRVRYGHVKGQLVATYRRRSRFWLNAAAALRTLLASAKAEEENAQRDGAAK